MIQLLADARSPSIIQLIQVILAGDGHGSAFVSLHCNCEVSVLALNFSLLDCSRLVSWQNMSALPYLCDFGAAG